MSVDGYKVVVFDLDETLGCFAEYGIFWDGLESYLKSTLTRTTFNQVLDLYPEFFRPNIISILKYLKNKKQSSGYHKVMIYTNNQGPKVWTVKIRNYFHDKLKYNLFDRVIAAFRIRGHHVELCRTTHDKTVTDLLNCTKLPKDTKICFLDDVFHPEMEHEQVYYINVKPYTHDLRATVMIDRFLTSKIGRKLIANKAEFNKFIKAFFRRYDFYVKPKTEEEQEIDRIISKKIMLHLQEFFKRASKNAHTEKRHHHLSHNKTLKRR